MATPINVPVLEEQTQRRTRHLPRFRVILHNDDQNTRDHVIVSITRLTTLSHKEAVQRTSEAEASGCSLLLVTHQERAELYVEQFASLSLTVTCEPDA